MRLVFQVLSYFFVMDILKCIIIEDQLPAQEILQRYIEEVPNLELVGTYVSPLKALSRLKGDEIDVLFLDVHLPKISGIELLSVLPNPPAVILTTAFEEYAVKGFEMDVIDYLLKPFSFERFLKSIHKIQRIAKSEKPIIHRQALFAKSKHVIQRIDIEDIKYIEAKGDFILLCTSSQRHMANISLSDILPKIGAHFIRCHKSFIINIQAIERINGNRILINNKEIPIGRTFREGLLQALEMI